MISDNRNTRRGRSRSPLRAALNAMTKSTGKALSPPRAVSPIQTPLLLSSTNTTSSVTAVITKIKAKENGKGGIHKVITLKLTSKNFWAVEGQALKLSNRRCRLQYDPEASGHMRVITIPSGTFEVASANPSTGTVKLIVDSHVQDDPDCMQAFLFRDAVVGSNFTLSQV